MSFLDLFARDAVGTLDLSDAPSDQQTAHIRRRAQELVNLEARLERAEKLVEDIKTRKTFLSMKLLPELFDAAQTDTIGLPESNVDVTVTPYVFASIRKDLPEEQREAMFAHLESLGGGSLPQALVSVSFPKEDLSLARKFVEAASAWLVKTLGNSQSPPVALDLSVHHGTLTSWLKDELDRREQRTADGLENPPLDPALLGATIGRVCQIKKRRKSKSSRKFRK